MSNIRKRPSKDSWLMSIAEDVAQRSPDPVFQVGAVIVDKNNRIISTGFNGPPAGFLDESLDYLDRESVRPFLIHAEVNAILYSGSRFEGSKLYVSLSPCQECIKIVAASGIKTIIFRDMYKDFEITRVLAEKFGITLIQFKESIDG